MHVPGVLNPADILTRPATIPEEVEEGSVWQYGPAYLALPKDKWPFSRDFRDILSQEEMRKPWAKIGLVEVETWECLLGSKLTSVVQEVMERSNSYAKTVHVTARLLKCIFSASRSRIEEPLAVDDIMLARKVQFIASMGPTVVAMGKGDLDVLRPVVVQGIVYVRGRCDGSLMELLGIDRYQC